MPIADLVCDPEVIDRFIEIVQNFRSGRNRLTLPGFEFVAKGIEVAVGPNPRKSKQIPCPAKGFTPLQDDKRFVGAALPQVTGPTDTGDTRSDDQDIDMLMPHYVSRCVSRNRCLTRHDFSRIHSYKISASCRP